MTKLYYAYTNVPPKTGTEEKLIKMLPVNLKIKLLAYKKEPDKQLMLTALALLLKALEDNNCSIYSLHNLVYDKTGRPYFPGANFDFNISHTDGCAAVVFSNNCRVGIDIEKIKGIDLSDFINFFPEEQWNEIISADDKLQKFYYYWTLIESGVKADGGGLTLTTEKKVKLINRKLFIDENEWFYNHYSFDESISCCISNNIKSQTIQAKEVTLFR
jgi:4'-phosphopantetheinyl transferase